MPENATYIIPLIGLVAAIVGWAYSKWRQRRIARQTKNCFQKVIDGIEPISFDNRINAGRHVANEIGIPVNNRAAEKLSKLLLRFSRSEVPEDTATAGEPQSADNKEDPFVSDDFTGGPFSEPLYEKPKPDQRLADSVDCTDDIEDNDIYNVPCWNCGTENDVSPQNLEKRAVNK